MKMQSAAQHEGQRTKLRWNAIGAAMALGLLLAAGPLMAQGQQDQNSNATGSDKGGHSIGFIASDRATEGDVGLPLYPGSRPHKDKDNDSPAAQLGLWGGDSGFKLAVRKEEVNDSPDKVKMFYAKALAKYGKVLNCSNPPAAASEKDKSKPSRELTCDDEKPDSGEVLLKSGTKEKQHLVGITPNGSGSVYQLVYLEAKGLDSK